MLCSAEELCFEEVLSSLVVAEVSVLLSEELCGSLLSDELPLSSSFFEDVLCGFLPFEDVSLLSFEPALLLVLEVEFESEYGFEAEFEVESDFEDDVEFESEFIFELDPSAISLSF